MLATDRGFIPSSDRLSRYCDSVLHWDCYAGWSERPRFARAFFQMMVEDEKTDPYSGKSYLDDALLITVHLRPPFEKAHLYLADTGTRHFVELVDWQSWITSDGGNLDAEHPLVRAALEPLLPALRQRFPTADHLVRAVDWAGKAPMIAEADERRERERVAEAQNRKVALEKLAANNAAVPALHEDLTHGRRACPHCGRSGSGFVLKDGGADRSSFVVCTGCGRSLWPGDFSS